MRINLLNVWVSVFLAAGLSFGADLGAWNPRKAMESSNVDSNGVRWIDGRHLPLEGRAFGDTECYYDRLPADVTTNVNDGVRKYKHHTSGMQFRFATDSKRLRFLWKSYNGNLQLGHMPSTGVSGIDVYRFDAAKSRWCYVKTGRINDAAKGGDLFVDWVPDEPCLVNLPHYNGLREFSVGIDSNATIRALPPRTSGINKPVVFYGTSITHGGCCSRPGLSFVNRVGRDLDVPVVGLGFSGSGVMELEMSEHLARIDASCYVLDCLWNMGSAPQHAMAGRNVEENYEPFVRNLRARRPDVPIVMAEACDVFEGGGEYSPRLDAMDRYLHGLYERLVAEGWKDLHYLSKEGMYEEDGEGTVDGVHPNDLGMKTLSIAFGRAVRKALSETRTDDTEQLQALLDSGKGRVEFPDGTYTVSRPLVISSNTHLVCSPRTVVRLADQANCPVLRNRGSEPGGADCNIIVEGGVWDGNNVNQTRGPFRAPNVVGGGDINQLTVFAGVSNLTLRGMTLKDPDSYCIELSDVVGFVIEDIVFDCNDKTLNQDGLHIDGYARDGYVRNLRGHTNDDMVALNSDEGCWRSPSNDIENVTIDGVYGGEDGYTAVRLLSRNAHVRNIVVRNVYGGFKYNGVSFTHWAGKDHKPGMGHFDNVLIEKFFAWCCLKSGGRYGSVYFQNGVESAGTIVVRDLRRVDPPDCRNRNHTIRIEPNVKIRKLVLDNVDQELSDDRPLLSCDPTSKIEALVLR